MNYRDELARSIASHISGIDGANPEQDDYDLADKMIYRMADVWDECVRSIVYDTGNPVEIVGGVNPYRVPNLTIG